MTAKIVFPELKGSNGHPLEIRRVSGVTIERSFKNLTQTAEITLPRRNFLLGNGKVGDVIRKGVAVEVWLGYGEPVLELKGYVTRISADVPLVLKVEDEMWKAKQTKVNFSSKNISLKDLLQKIAPGYSVDAVDVALGDVRFANTNLGAVLKTMQDDWKIYSYFLDGTLVSGKYFYERSAAKATNFHLERNVVSSNLEYRNKEDIVLKLKAVSILRGGGKLEYETGTDGGDNMELTYYNITDKSQLKAKADKDYELASTGGFDGSFTAFGSPSVDFGHKVALRSSIYEDKNGLYYIESVKKSFGASGYRQDIKLAGRVS